MSPDPVFIRRTDEFIKELDSRTAQTVELSASPVLDEGGEVVLDYLTIGTETMVYVSGLAPKKAETGVAGVPTDYTVTAVYDKGEPTETTVEYPVTFYQGTMFRLELRSDGTLLESGTETVFVSDDDAPAHVFHPSLPSEVSGIGVRYYTEDGTEVRDGDGVTVGADSTVIVNVVFDIPEEEPEDWTFEVVYRKSDGTVLRSEDISVPGREDTYALTVADASGFELGGRFNWWMYRGEQVRPGDLLTVPRGTTEITLTADVTPDGILLSVMYRMPDGTVTSDSSTVTDSNVTFTVRLLPSDTHRCTFTGWVDGDGTPYEPMSSVTLGPGNTTLTLTAVTTDANWVSMGEVSVKVGVSTPVTEVFSLGGYTFDGVFESPDGFTVSVGGGTVYMSGYAGSLLENRHVTVRCRDADGGVVYLYSDVRYLDTVYTYTVRYTLPDGTVTTDTVESRDRTVTYTVGVDVPPSDLVLVGWSRDGGVTVIPDGGTVTISEDTVFTAVTGVRHRLKATLFDGSGNERTVLVEGDSRTGFPVTFSDPVYAGRLFDGWALREGGSATIRNVIPFGVTRAESGDDHTRAVELFAVFSDDLSDVTMLDTVYVKVGMPVNVVALVDMEDYSDDLVWWFGSRNRPEGTPAYTNNPSLVKGDVRDQLSVPFDDPDLCGLLVISEQMKASTGDTCVVTYVTGTAGEFGTTTVYVQHTRSGKVYAFQINRYEEKDSYMTVTYTLTYDVRTRLPNGVTVTDGTVLVMDGEEVSILEQVDKAVVQRTSHVFTVGGAFDGRLTGYSKGGAETVLPYPVTVTAWRTMPDRGNEYVRGDEVIATYPDFPDPVLYAEWGYRTDVVLVTDGLSVVRDFNGVTLTGGVYRSEVCDSDRLNASWEVALPTDVTPLGDTVFLGWVEDGTDTVVNGNTIVPLDGGVHVFRAELLSTECVLDIELRDLTDLKFSVNSAVSGLASVFAGCSVSEPEKVEDENGLTITRIRVTGTSLDGTAVSLPVPPYEVGGKPWYTVTAKTADGDRRAVITMPVWTDGDTEDTGFYDPVETVRTVILNGETVDTEVMNRVTVPSGGSVTLTLVPYGLEVEENPPEPEERTVTLVLDGNSVTGSNRVGDKVLERAEVDLGMPAGKNPVTGADGYTTTYTPVGWLCEANGRTYSGRVDVGVEPRAEGDTSYDLCDGDVLTSVYTEVRTVTDRPFNLTYSFGNGVSETRVLAPSVLPSGTVGYRDPSPPRSRDGVPALPTVTLAWMDTPDMTAGTSVYHFDGVEFPYRTAVTGVTLYPYTFDGEPYALTLTDGDGAGVFRTETGVTYATASSEFPDAPVTRVVLPSEHPDGEGRFSGWSVSSDGASTVYRGGSTITVDTPLFSYSEDAGYTLRLLPVFVSEQVAKLEWWTLDGPYSPTGASVTVDENTVFERSVTSDGRAVLTIRGPVYDVRATEPSYTVTVTGEGDDAVTVVTAVSKDTEPVMVFTRHIRHLENVNSISKTLTSTINPNPIMTRPAEDAIIMDVSGVSGKFTVGFTRVQPDSPDDTSADSRKWSMAMWKKDFEEFTNEWTSLHYRFMETEGVSGEWRRTGGFLFTFTPVDEFADCIPPVVENVFIGGSLTNDLGARHVSTSLTLTMGSMHPQDVTGGTKPGVAPEVTYIWDGPGSPKKVPATAINSKWYAVIQPYSITADTSVKGWEDSVTGDTYKEFSMIRLGDVGEKVIGPTLKPVCDYPDFITVLPYRFDEYANGSAGNSNGRQTQYRFNPMSTLHAAWGKHCNTNNGVPADAQVFVDGFIVGGGAGGTGGSRSDNGDVGGVSGQAGGVTVIPRILIGDNSEVFCRVGQGGPGRHQNHSIGVDFHGARNGTISTVRIKGVDGEFTFSAKGGECGKRESASVVQKGSDKTYSHRITRGWCASGPFGTGFGGLNHRARSNRTNVEDVVKEATVSDITVWESDWTTYGQVRTVNLMNGDEGDSSGGDASPLGTSLRFTKGLLSYGDKDVCKNFNGFLGNNTPYQVWKIDMISNVNMGGPNLLENVSGEVRYETDSSSGDINNSYGHCFASMVRCTGTTGTVRLQSIGGWGSNRPGSHLEKFGIEFYWDNSALSKQGSPVLGTDLIKECNGNTLPPVEEGVNYGVFGGAGGNGEHTNATQGGVTFPWDAVAPVTNMDGGGGHGVVVLRWWIQRD